MVNRANCPNMVEEGRCAIPWEIRRHHISKSHHIMKLLESRARIMGRTAIQKGKMRTALKQLVEKKFEMQGRMVVGFVDLLRKMVYADDLAIIAESKQELQEVLEE